MLGERELVTAPASEPVTRNEVKEHARVTGTADDTYIDDLISAARLMLEQMTGLALIDQTWRIWFDQPALKDNLGWWDGVREGALSLATDDFLNLAPNPLSSITSITSYSIDNTATVFSSANYFADTVTKPARAVLNSGKAWPAGLRSKNALAVEFVAGYGASASAVPFDVRHVVKMAATNLYEVRGDRNDLKAQSAMEKIIAPLVQRYRIRTL